MVIRGKRIRSLDRHLKGFKQGEKVVVALRDIFAHKAALAEAGFSAKLNPGESVLPAAAFGPVSDYNANGKDVPQKDQPKETAYRTVEWSWTEWHGRNNRVEKTEFRDRAYERYPRKHFSPPSVDLQIALDPDGNKLIVPEALDPAKQEDLLLHTVNLFLEIFGECELVSESLKSVVRAKVIRLNWHLLPPGKHPWKSLAATLDPIIKQNPGGNQPFVTDRLNKINGYDPEFVAYGRGGFYGYVVFGFSKKNLYVFESALHGNATYVFEADWQKLSQLTKAEIIDGKLHKARIVHLKSWYGEIYKLLN